MKCVCGHKVDHQASDRLTKIRTKILLLKGVGTEPLRVEVICPNCRRSVLIGIMNASLVGAGGDDEQRASGW